jgi:hypothetical protein
MLLYMRKSTAKLLPDQSKMRGKESWDEVELCTKNDLRKRRRLEIGKVGRPLAIHQIGFGLRFVMFNKSIGRLIKPCKKRDFFPFALSLSGIAYFS